MFLSVIPIRISQDNQQICSRESAEFQILSINVITIARRIERNENELENLLDILKDECISNVWKGALGFHKPDSVEVMKKLNLNKGTLLINQDYYLQNWFK